MMRLPWRTWRLLGPWGRAFVRAALVLVTLHVLVMRWAIVQSISMYATLTTGDVLVVERWPKWTGLERGDIIIFRDPTQDHEALTKRRSMVKRLIGLPGDTVIISSGKVFVNGRSIGPFPGETRRYLVQVSDSMPREQLLDLLGLPAELSPRPTGPMELPLTEERARDLLGNGLVERAEPFSASRGRQRHLFPFSARHAWNSDNYGPFEVPRKGALVPLDVDELPRYDRIITQYEGHDLQVSRGQILLDGQRVDHYRIEQDHFFVLGDARHNSSDSRFWGTVPEDHIIGRARAIICSWNEEKQRFRSERWFRTIDQRQL
ncbi:MAG: signal peptidase I [Flavobacteriales bacterium]|nr:signal peptidase I [Flavobacteriales bacterium]